jgi:uncharacterized membrane protein
MTETGSPSNQENPYSQANPEPEPVWTYRGYRLRSSEFTTAMAHFFRAEVQRANVWRSRLDTTTNWAVVATGAALTIAFSQSSHHGVILLNVLLVTLFLFIEARRYRYYELWSSRIRLMETDFYAAMLVPPFQPSPDWAESLAENLLQPHFPISMWEAIGRRLRRNYIWIYLILAIAWLAKTALYPTPVNSWNGLLVNGAIGPIPGAIVITAGIIFMGGVLLLALLTAGLQQATGEVLPRYTEGKVHVPVGEAEPNAARRRAWFRASQRRQQLLALVITDRAQVVGEQILKELKRGVTAMPGTGMYTGKSHSVLMCALTVTEANHLKAVVSATDPQAFVIVSPAQEILGRGFLPLKTETEQEHPGG